MSRNTFWLSIFIGVITWIVGSTVWYVFFEPQLKQKGII